MRNITRFALLAGPLFPAVVMAQGTIDGILQRVLDIMGILVPVIITLALIYFLWGVAKYVGSGGDSGARSEGLSMMISGIIALFVIVSVWGLVAVLNDTFSVDQGGSVEIPQIPGGGGFNFGGFNF